MTLLASVLTAAGYRPGVYTSPHLLRLEERIAVGRRAIAPDDLAFLLRHNAEAVRRVAQAEAGALSHFEVMTALAFRWEGCCGCGAGTRQYEPVIGISRHNKETGRQGNRALQTGVGVRLDGGPSGGKSAWRGAREGRWAEARKEGEHIVCRRWYCME